VNDIRNHDYYNQHKLKLEGIGFCYRSIHEVSFDFVYMALKVYKELHGTLNVPFRFTIPYDDEDEKRDYNNKIDMDKFETSTTLELNSTNNNKSKRFIINNTSRRNIVSGYDAIGISDKIRSVQIDSQKEKQKVISWPKELQGMKLGSIVNDIRNKDHYSKHMEELKELGFKFSMKSQL
jgi:hypothetical protein